MYKVIIVNSDNAEAKSLSDMISDEFSVEGMFSKAEDALAYLKTSRTDIVIIDISCGISEISKIISCGCEILMLCAYRDLKLAKAASDAGVNYYLLKPVRFDEFSYAMSSVKLELDRRNISRLQSVSSLDFNQFLPILREQFFSSVTNGEISSRQELREKATELSMEQSICGMPCALIEVHITDYHNYITNKWKYGRETLYTAVKNLLSDNEQFSFQMTKARGEKMQFVVLPSKHVSAKTLGDSLRHYTNKCTRTAFELFGMILFIEAKRYFSSLFEMMEFSCKNRSEENTEPEYSGNAERLVTSLKMRDTANGEKIIDEYKSSLGEISPENTATFLFNVLNIVCDKLFSEDTHAEEMRKKNEAAFLKQSQDNDELFENAKHLLSEYVACLKKEALRSDEIVIKKAKKYIHDNCGEDISLSEVAQSVYLNPVYFSRMFKAKTGENFSSYLFRVRMKTAAELLESGVSSISKVAKAAGYKNTKYFSRLFKKYSGFTPRDYLYMHMS